MRWHHTMTLRGTRRSGVTLVEAVIAVAVSSVLLAAVMTVLVMGHRMWRLKETRLDERRRLRLAVEEMAQTLRGAKSIFVTRSKDGVRLTLTRYKGGAIVYTWTPAGDLWRQAGQNRRRIGGPFQEVRAMIEHPFCAVRLSTQHESVGFLVMPRRKRLESLP